MFSNCHFGNMAATRQFQLTAKAVFYNPAKKSGQDTKAALFLRHCVSRETYPGVFSVEKYEDTRWKGEKIQTSAEEMVSVPNTSQPRWRRSVKSAGPSDLSQ